MSIAEAAKAFLAFAYPETKQPMKGVVFNGEKFVYELDGHEAYTHKFFELFCAGIAHAEEMAKPTVRIIPPSFGLRVRDTKGGTIIPVYKMVGLPTVEKLFQYREDAVKWAVDNGYRVLD